MKMQGIVVINLHDVLIDFQHAIYLELVKNFTKFSRFIEKPVLMSPAQFSKRKEYNALSLMRKKYTGSDAIVKFKQDISSVVSGLNVLMKNPTFYTNCRTLPLMENLLKDNFTLVEFNKFKKIIILIDKYNDEQAKNAYAFCERVFNHSKFGFIVVDNKNKSDLMTHELKTFSLYIDHDINNIRRIAEKTPSLIDKEFMIPRYEFNKMSTDLSILIQGKNGAFTYF